MRLHKLAFVGAVFASFATGMYSGAATAQQELNLRFADFLPATLPQMQVDQWFADELDRRSNGKIKIKIFFGSALGKPTELLKLEHPPMNAAVVIHASSAQEDSKPKRVENRHHAKTIRKTRNR